MKDERGGGGDPADAVESTDGSELDRQDDRSANGPHSGDLVDGTVRPEVNRTDTSDVAAPEIAAQAKPANAGTTLLRQLRRWGPIRRWLWYRLTRRDWVDHAEFWNERDPRENDETRLPASITLDVPAIWVVELYTPSTVQGLLDGIRELGWEFGWSRSESLAKWMDDVRRGRSAGWTNLGLVSPRKDRHIGSERVAEFPNSIRAVFPMLMSLTPSVTALVTCFTLTDAAAASLVAPMRADYQTFTKRGRVRLRQVATYVVRDRWPGPLSGSLMTPMFQRREAVQTVLDDLESDCTTWIERNLPGAFSSGLRGGLFPTAMLFVSEGFQPLTEEARRIRALDGTDLDADYDAWEAPEWPHVRMCVPHGWRKEELRLKFAAERNAGFPVERYYHEPTSNWTVSQRADEMIRGLASKWALSCALDGYHQRLSEYRDLSARRRFVFRPVKDLRALRDLVRTDAYDILTAATEVNTFAKNKRAYEFETLNPKYVRDVRGASPRFLKSLRVNQIDRAAQLEDETRLLLTTLGTSAEMTQTISNIRLQRAIGLLTLISLAIAIVAVIVALNASG